MTNQPQPQPQQPAKKTVTIDPVKLKDFTLKPSSPSKAKRNVTEKE